MYRAMSKSTKITLIFILIFVIGVLSFVASINYSLNHPNSHYFQEEPSL
jgi:preprotein translocase subunit SecE